jgi:hypothetical protein
MISNERIGWLAILLIPLWGQLCFSQTEPMNPGIAFADGMTVELEIKVTDVLKKPLAGVQIDYSSWEKKREGNGITDSAGEFRTTEFPGTYFIRAVRQGFKPWIETNVIIKDFENRKLNIILLPEGPLPNIPIPKPPSNWDRTLPWGVGMDAIFEVTVTDINKNPVAGASVNYRNLEKNMTGGGATNAAGRFRSSYVPGQSRFEVMGRGFKRWVSKGITLKSGETQKIDVVLVSKSTSGGVANPKSEDYTQRALGAVRSELEDRNENPDKLRLAAAGELILKPDCSGLHSKGAKAPEAPDAIALINLYKKNSIREQAKVMFLDGQPEVALSRRLSGFSVDEMDEAELRLAAKEIDSYFTTAVNIQLGSERFYKYLPENIRSMFMYSDRKLRMYMPPGAVDESWREQLSKELASRGARQRPLQGIDGWREKLSDDELRQFAALTLDLTAQGIWFAFEGLEGIEGSNLKIEQLVSNPPGYIGILKEAVSKNRSRLESSGFLGPEHLNLTSSYIKQLMGEGLIVKEVSHPKPCPCFKEGLKDKTLYLVSMGPWRIHFSRTNAIPRIACIALP